jgi:hypothetical protein
LALSFKLVQLSLSGVQEPFVRATEHGPLDWIGNAAEGKALDRRHVTIFHSAPAEEVVDLF